MGREPEDGARIDFRIKKGSGMAWDVGYFVTVEVTSEVCRKSKCSGDGGGSWTSGQRKLDEARRAEGG